MSRHTASVLSALTCLPLCLLAASCSLPQTRQHRACAPLADVPTAEARTRAVRTTPVAPVPATEAGKPEVPTAPVAPVTEAGAWEEAIGTARARRKSMALSLAVCGAAVGYGLVFWD